MSSTGFSRDRGSFAALRRFARSRRQADADEHCELCSVALGPEHEHLVDPAHRQLVCACNACAILFDNGGGRFVRVPRRVLALPDFRLSDEQWDDLMIPIGMAFFFHSTPAGRMVAFYPSPAGATESLLPLEAWGEIVRVNPVLETLHPDVEALLVNRMPGREGDGPAYFLAPVDQCYRLVGLIRRNWRGLSGGREVWDDIGRFFDELKQVATTRRSDG